MSNAISVGNAVVGCELGSTRIKISLAAPDGTPLASGSHGWENRFENGVWTYHTDDVWHGIASAWSDLAADVQNRHGERLERIAERAMGFVYAVGLLGVTGERDQLAASAVEIARRCKAVTDKPVLVGVGIGSPAQAVEVCEVADGVVIGSAVVRRALETRSPEAVAEVVGEYRTALDAG